MVEVMAGVVGVGGLVFLKPKCNVYMNMYAAAQYF